MRVIAVDWSGAVQGAADRIWLAEVEEGRVARLENGRRREALVAHLIDLSRDTDRVVVGLDFAFSLPAWFAEERGLLSARAVWDRARLESEQWLRSCEPPFWGREGRSRPEMREHFRLTEREAESVAGVRPKSVFQIAGAGAVGTGSLRGMPFLAQLQDAGFAIWPFDESRTATVVEIYPRLLTGSVVKSDPEARHAYLRARFPDLDSEIARRAASSEDAFDAMVSALVMWRHRDELRTLAPATDETTRLEGGIWVPERPVHESNGLATVNAPARSAPTSLRSRLVEAALEWERRFGVAPAITSALSEYDAARLVGHTDDTFGVDCVGRTSVTRGCDFTLGGVRYQVKANRPSGKPGSFVTLVGKASNYEWDRLIWMLYDRHYVLQEAWEWTVEEYRAAFHEKPRLAPADMRGGRCLHRATRST